MTTPSEPFTRASILFGPIFEAHGFKVVSREYAEGSEGSAFAEYARGDVSLRLVWEGDARSIWIEAARRSGGSVISRWIDIEWSLAGERLPLDTDLSDDRFITLGDALERFLDRPASDTADR